MLKHLLLFISISLIVISCGEKAPEPVTDIDVAGKFIKDIFVNDFKDARKYLLPDTANTQLFDRFQESYRSKPKEQLDRYKDADLIINEVTPLNDSVTVINYTNSYDKTEKNKVKVVRQNGKWLIDLKYTFSGNL